MTAWKPIHVKIKSNGDKRCQTLIKRGTRKPGSYTQCRNSVAHGKRLYCEKHNSALLSVF